MSTPLNQINQLHESQLYLYFYEEALTPERTREECAFIEKAIDLKQRARILDLACGHGRHANFFAQKGRQVTGVDINADFVRLARETAEKQRLGINFQEGNILEIDFEEAFDVALLLFNTFGFFDRTDGQLLLQKTYRALKPGGRLFLDTKNRDHLLKEIKPCHIVEKGQDLMIDRLSFDPLTGTTLNRRIYIKDDKRIDAPFKMYAYHFSELVKLTHTVGFVVEKIYGGWKGESFSQESRRIILILKKV